MELKRKIHSELVKFYPSCVLDEDSKNDELIVRLSLQDVSEVEDFKNTLSGITNTEWITKKENSDSERFTFWKRWVCQHNQLHKSPDSKRNANCKAQMTLIIKKITKHTIRKDKFLKQSPPLPVWVTLSTQHTHSVHSAESLRMLRVTEEVKNNFSEYFSSGMTPAEAIMHHETKFLLDNNYEDLANASKNPTRRQVHYLHDCWRTINLGSYLTPLEKLREKIPSYNSNGSIIKIYDVNDGWAVLLVSPIMKRTQFLAASKEMIFIDSTCSCERTSSTLTVLLSATKAGAIPIATLIHKCQTTENYLNAFTLLKESFPKCFGGEDFPAIFMTDDSTAEKTALATVWPNSTQLLCHFHVAQAEWRWLFSKNSKVQKEERPRLMKLFQNVMYATTERNLSEAVREVQKEKKHPQFVTRFNSFFLRRKEWVLLDRSLTRDNNTNNYAESTIRIVKDIVLNRTKAFNVVALIEFCLEVWEKFLARKLLEYAHSRRRNVDLIFKSVYEKSKFIKDENVRECAPNLFEVKSDNVNKSYTINTDLGVCTCPTGMYGAFCKHQCFFLMEKKLSLPNAPPISVEEKYALAKLALGDKCPPPSFFSEFIERDTSNPPSLEEEMSAENNQSYETCDMEIEPLNQNANDEKKNEMAVELDRIKDVLCQSTLKNRKVNDIVNKLKQIKSADDFDKLMFFKSTFRERKIKVQPTSISRRRVGLTRTKTRVPGGRPPGKITKSLKRKRCLKSSIIKNIPNAKSH